MISDIVWYTSTGAALGLSGGLAAGPLSALVISQTLRYGLREGLAVSWAPVLTDGPLLLAGALIMHRLQNVSVAMGVISAAGAVFLVWLALDCARGSTSTNFGGADAPPGSIRKALLTNVLNPHPYLFWFAVGGPVVAEAWLNNIYCVIGFLLAFFGCLVGSKMGIALLTHKLGRFIGGRLYQMVMLGLSGMIIVCAIYFALEAAEHLRIVFQS